jgi:nucleoside-diphosphate-sugar epimerase
MTDEILQQDGKTVAENVNLSSLTDKTVLITGASGLIGTCILYTLEALPDSDKPARVFATFRKGLPDWLRVFEREPWLKFLQGDLADTTFLQTLPEADYIIHAGTYGQPGFFMEEQVTTLKINTTATFALLEKLNAGGKFLFTSSSAVYQDATSLPFKETHAGLSNTNHPRACYIEAKRCGEAIVEAYRAGGIDAKAVRIAMVYGPGIRIDTDKRVLNTFIRKSITAPEIDMMDDGSAEKVYIYVTDAVEMLLHVLLEGKSDIYNIGGKERVSILQLAEFIGAKSGKPVRKGAGEQTKQYGAPPVEWLDTEKYETEFGAKAFVPFEEGVLRTMHWCMQTMK